MITLFRRMRQKLIDSSSITKYLLYAIGEILLVVIGILIALQVNNWNEERKADQFEQEILYLIDQNLQRDAAQLSDILAATNQANTLTDRLLEQVDAGIYGDSLNYWMGKIISFERFKSQSSAFEVLKARGIETISNKELQLALIAYYDVNLFGIYQSLEDVEKSFIADWIPFIKQNFSDFKWKSFLEPVNSKAFFEDPSTIVLFKLYQDNREGSVDDLEDALLIISKIRGLIETQLQ